MHMPPRKTILSLAVALLAVVLLSPPAVAATSVPASGTFTIAITPQTVTTHGEITVISFSLVETITGTLSGTRVGSGTLVVHSDGTFEARDTGTFTGTIAGRTGAATLSVVARGVLGSSVAGRFVTSDGIGGLAVVHTQGGFAGVATSPLSFAGTYSGRIETRDNEKAA